MDGSESETAPQGQGATNEAGETDREATHDAASRAAEGLRSQIAALRKQVKDAQDTLRDQHRRQEDRSFKR